MGEEQQKIFSEAEQASKQVNPSDVKDKKEPKNVQWLNEKTKRIDS